MKVSPHITKDVLEKNRSVYDIFLFGFIGLP